jgi:hypothetical protein
MQSSNLSSKLSLSLSVLGLLAACTAPRAAAEGPPAEAAPVEAPLAVEPEVEVEPEPALPSATLERLAHQAWMTEVVLDPRGEAALTLDSDGGVRLWPSLDLGFGDEQEPYRIPVHEPLWLSLAKLDSEPTQGFTLGFVATNNAGSVYRVTPGETEWTITESFALSPEDPLLELHVLDGGARILALGVDHRVRLYSVEGELVSVIDERSFGPWQLRVSGGVGEPPKLAAILAQPLRVQPLRLVDDVLEIAGPARALELDRGPNRNDLELSPDGTTIATLRRPRRNHPQWSVELIDLATDDRRLIAGRVDTKLRPRMHFVGDDRLLLESGSGRGYLVDLSLAAAPAKIDDLQPDSKFAKRLAGALSHERVDLPASAERWATPEDDTGIRMHASVVNGVRASIDALAGRTLSVEAVAKLATASTEN